MLNIEERAWPRDVIAAAIILLLFAELLGVGRLLNPRKCPACQRSYHRGEKCDWSAPVA